MPPDDESAASRTFAQVRCSAVCLGLGLSCALLAGLARAHLTYPISERVIVAPGGEGVLVRATYGLLLRSAAPDSWSWVCRQSPRYSDYEDPAVLITSSGTIVSGSSAGLYVSRDGGCDFVHAGDPLSGLGVVGLGQTGGGRLVGLFVSTGTAQRPARLFESTDDAGSWSELGAPIDANFTPYSFAVAPGDGSRFYATAVSADTDSGVLLISSDRGDSFTSHPIPGSDERDPPHVLAGSPADPQTVFVRLDGKLHPGTDGGTFTLAPDRLLVSRDGGQSFEELIARMGELSGLAFSPDEKTLLVAFADARDGTPLGPDDIGLFRASADTLSFEQVLDGSISCVTWTEAEGVIVCADPEQAPFDLGQSTDGARSFEPYLQRRSIRGPLECPPGASTAERCSGQWPVTCQTLGLDTCPPPAGATPRDAGAGFVDGPDAGPVERGKGGGCAVVAGKTSGPTSAWLAWVAALGAAWFRQRRRRQGARLRTAPDTPR